MGWGGGLLWCFCLGRSTIGHVCPRRGSSMLYLCANTLACTHTFFCACLHLRPRLLKKKKQYPTATTRLSSPSEWVLASGRLSPCPSHSKSFLPGKHLQGNAHSAGACSQLDREKAYVRKSSYVHRGPKLWNNNPPYVLTASTKHPASLLSRAPPRASPSRPHSKPQPR